MKSSRVRLILLAAILMFAAAARLAWLESTPLEWDEFVTLGRAKLALADIWRSLSFAGPSDVSLDFSPPLLHLILHPVLALGGASETWVKLPSVLCGVLTVLALYPLGTRLFGGRSGLFASALLALSLYHLHVSREARPYSLYLMLAVTSLWLLTPALESNRARHWGLYSLSLAGALYASYLGGANLLAQGLFLAGLAVTRSLPPGRMLPAALSLGGAVAAYLPWLPGQIFHMELISSSGTGDSGIGLTWEFLSRALLEFVSQSVLLLACAGFGVLVGLWRNPRGAALILCWLLLPMATSLALRTGISVNPRFLIAFVPGLALLAGAGLDGLVKGLSLGLPGRAAALLGLFAAVGLSWPSLAALPDYYRRDAHSVRDDLLDVARAAANADSMAFPRNRRLKVFTRWYLPGVFEDLSHSSDLRYRRVLLLFGPEDSIPQGMGQPERFGDLTVFRAGLLNVSPLAGAGLYRADFSNLNFYREAALWDNAGPDLFRKTLSLYDPERPGRAVWRFTAPEGGFTDDAVLFCRLRLTHGVASKPSDATVSIAAGSTPDGLAVLRTVTQADFTGGELELTLTLPKPSGPELAVGLILDPGTVYGSLEPVSLEVAFPGAAAGTTTPTVTPSVGQDELRRRVDLASWTPGLTLAGDAPLLAFATGDPALAEFRACHPGLAPVAELPGPSSTGGKGGLIVFDPALSDPFFPAPGGSVLTEPAQAGGLVVKGPMAGQTVTLGGAAVQLPLTAPPGSTLALAPGGRGRLWAALDFSRDHAEASGGAFASFNTALLPGQSCLTCAGENACFAVYALASRAPVRAVRVAFTPEIYGEPGQENAVSLSVSTDGNAYRTVDSLTVQDSELWEGKKRRIAWIRLDRPSERVYLRFELTSDKARIWSGPEHPLRIDAWLDPAAPMPRALAQQPFTPASDGPPVRLYVSPTPLPDLDRLLPRH
jgi:hypothetical protein